MSRRRGQGEAATWPLGTGRTSVTALNVLLATSTAIVSSEATWISLTSSKSGAFDISV